MMDEFRVIEQLRAKLELQMFGPPEQSLRELASELGIDHAQLLRFKHGQVNLGLVAFARVCKHLKLELKPITEME